MALLPTSQIKNKMYSYTNNWFDSLNKKILTVLNKTIGYSQRPTHILEIGAYEGCSTIFFAENLCQHPESSITTVDYWPNKDEVQKTFHQNISLCSNSEKIKLLNMPSLVALSSLIKDHRNHFDLIYIDGSHTAADVITDAVLSYALAKPNGIIMFDDYLWRPERSLTQRPKLAIDTFTAIFSDNLTIMPTNSYTVVCQLSK